MPRFRRIDSARNPTVRELAALKERRARDRSGLMLVEGAREVERALAAGHAPRTLLVAPSLAPAAAETWARTVEERGGELLELSDEAFARISLREHPDGVAAVLPRLDGRLEDLELPPDPLVLVLDGIEKPGNVGALLRTADAVGVDAVLLTGPGTDLANPNVVRASMGSIFALRLATAPADEVRRWLRGHGVRVIATSPHADRPHWDARYRGPTAVVVGAEHVGLSGTWLDAADERVAIPMHARLADSLNVAVAGAVMLYEALRQRRADAPGTG